MIAAAVALVIGPLVGYLLVVVAPNREWFVRVNGVAISRAELVDVLRARRIDAALAGARFDPARETFETAARLTDDEVLRQRAGELGVTVDGADVDAHLAARLAPDLDPADLDDAARAAIEERKRQHADLRRLSIAQLERLAEGELLRRRTARALGRLLPDPQPQVRLRAVTVPDVRTAERIRRAARGGLGIEEAVGRTAIDARSADLGWLPYDALPPEAADLIRTLPPAELSPPFRREDRTIVLYVVKERDPARPLGPVVRRRLEERALESWLRTTRDAQLIDLRLDSATLDWVLDQLERTRSVLPDA